MAQLRRVLLTGALVSVMATTTAGPTSATGLSADGQRTASTGKVWQSVSTGADHGCGIQTDNTLWCWGYNKVGALGLGDTEDRFVPTRVGQDSDWAMVRAGRSHTCGIRTDHTLWCWGYNIKGQLGLGDTVERHKPRQVVSSTDWAWITTSQ